jgi:hypothetical protein
VAKTTSWWSRVRENKMRPDGLIVRNGIFDATERSKNGFSRKIFVISRRYF